MLLARAEITGALLGSFGSLARSEIEGVEDADEDENEDEFSDEGEGSEAEEGSDEGGAELEGEDKATAMEDLTVAFNKQCEDAREFYATLEAAAMAMASEETPADWAF